MGFLDHAFDLNDTPYTHEHLEYARRYWVFLIERVAPEWIATPQGRLKVYWQSNTVASAVRLIDTAKTLLLLAKCIVDESDPIFAKKVRQLLFSDGVQHKELATELMVGRFLTSFSNSLVMEPVCSIRNEKPGTQKTCDYTLSWDNEGVQIFVESTVFHIARVREWEIAVAQFKKEFERTMLKNWLNRGVHITAPLSLTQKTLSNREMRGLVRRIAREPSGRHAVNVAGDDLLLEWSPASHLDTTDVDLARQHARATPPGRFWTCGSGIEIGALAATRVRLKWPGDAENLVNRSLRNTLDGKRRQFELSAPYVLVMRILSREIPLENIEDLLIRRIFGNEQYRRISAVGVFVISFNQQAGGNLQQASLVSNPNAVHPVPETFFTHLARTSNAAGTEASE